MDWPRFIAALATVCAWAHAHTECVPVEILDPVRNSTIHGARPDIRWSGLSGVKVYRVQIESRVPEGRVIERITKVKFKKNVIADRERRLEKLRSWR